jgi:riboflavin kinase/FMN adenylyltransferase
LNFSDNILGKKLRIFFIERIRNERLFPDVLSLEKQIREDIEYAKEILRIKNPRLI